MAGVRLYFTGFGISKETLAHLRKTGISLAKPLNQVGGYLLSETQLRFAQNLIRPKSKKTVGNTLVDRGHLWHSITYQVFQNTLSLGTNLKYAAIHQFGGRTGKNHSVLLPARPFLGVTDEDEVKVKRIMVEYIEKSL
jgi:phage virion morphogenesis protein